VARPRPPEPSIVQAAREAYFAGDITAAEYLRLVLPAPGTLEVTDPVPGAQAEPPQRFQSIQERLKAKLKLG
jgi:hypothetical protein